MDMHECKVIFKPHVPRDQAEAIIAKYYPLAKIDTWQEKRLVGANLVSFAVVTLPFTTVDVFQNIDEVIRIETIMTFKSFKLRNCSQVS